MLVFKNMSILWVIIRTEIIDEQHPEITEDPTVCGIYDSKKAAVEEILKLHIEDDIDIGSPEWIGDTKPTEDLTLYKPTSEFIKERRAWMLDPKETDNNNTYTHRGNHYTLVSCVLGATHEYDPDVVELYKKSV